MGFIKTAGIGLGALFLVGACLGGEDGEPATREDKPAASRDVDAVVEEVVEDSQPSPGAIWRSNYDAHHVRIGKQLARRLPAYQLPTDSTNAALSSCREIAAGKPLTKRVRNAGVRWSADPAQVTVVLSVVAEQVCPDVAKTHTDQVEAKRKSDAVEARRRAAAAAKKAERERRALFAQEQAENVYYDNCTDVENAGAAPIYVGDPGYSRDLDRDGDGVACEQ